MTAARQPVESDSDPLADLERIHNTYQPGQPANPHASANVAATTGGRPIGSHDCHECAGTGFYRGVRVNQPKSHCFACKGKGWFRASYADRMRARDKAADRKASALTAKQAAFKESNPGLIEALTNIAGWHQFAGSMMQAFQKWGNLTDNQAVAARSALHRVEAKRVERNTERAKENAGKTGEVDTTSIQAMFDTAHAAGLKFPKFRTDRLVISRAGDESKNPGAIYVKCDGAYVGKVKGGMFMPVHAAPADIMALVREVAASPLAAAKVYGFATGTCSCCGRTLSDPQSIKAGIGPVCADKWGI